MTILSPALLLPLWYQALREEIGIAIPTNDRTHLSVQLYKARKESGDPQLERIILFMPNNGEVWLCRKEVEMEQ